MHEVPRRPVLAIDLGGTQLSDAGTHLEALASDSGIVCAARDVLDQGPARGLAALIDDPVDVTAELASRAADDGGDDCRAVVQRAPVALGAMRSGQANVPSPKVIVSRTSRNESMAPSAAAIGQRRICT